MAESFSYSHHFLLSPSIESGQEGAQVLSHQRLVTASPAFPALVPAMVLCDAVLVPEASESQTIKTVQDGSTNMAAVRLAELLMARHQALYAKHFRKEGVVHALQALSASHSGAVEQSPVWALLHHVSSLQHVSGACSPVECNTSQSCCDVDRAGTPAQRWLVNMHRSSGMWGH